MATRGMNRRGFLKWTGAGMLAVCSVPVRASEAKITPDGVTTNAPNIVFILADDMGTSAATARPG
jgi:hypothetical protein